MEDHRLKQEAASAAARGRGRISILPRKWQVPRRYECVYVCVSAARACIYPLPPWSGGGMLHVLPAPSRTRVRISSGLTALRIAFVFVFVFFLVFLCHAFPPIWGRQHFTPTNCDDIGPSASVSDFRSLLVYSSLSTPPPLLRFLSYSLYLPSFSLRDNDTTQEEEKDIAPLKKESIERKRINWTLYWRVTSPVHDMQRFLYGLSGLSSRPWGPRRAEILLAVLTM